MGNDAKKRTTDELVADDSTYKFLNSEGQFIPEHCKINALLEIYAKDPYATFRLGLVEEMLQNIETARIEVKRRINLCPRRCNDAIIKQRASEGKLTAFVSCIHCHSHEE